MRFNLSGSKHRLVVAFAIAAAFAFALVTLLPVQSFAQQISGDITGTVLDEQGLGVPNATVDATHIATGIKTTGHANERGEYRITNLPVGTYNLSASAANFGATSLRGVVVDLNKTTTANLRLRVGGVETTVEVTGVAPLIDTTTAQLQTTYGEIQSQVLPNTGSGGTGGGVLNLSLLSAGVAQASALGDGQGPSIGGLRPRANNFTIEGVDNNNKSVTGYLAQVPNDAVADFTLLQNQFTPEFGHSPGGQFNVVVKSGTNSFHGSVYEYFKNRNLNALDNTYVLQGFTSPPRYDNNRYGATFGGPAIKDKVFFFTNFERQPVGQTGAGGGTVQAPTAAGLALIDSHQGAAGSLPPVSANNYSAFKTYVPVAAAQDQTCGAAHNQPCYIAFTGIGNGTTGGIPVGSVSISGPAFTNYMNFLQSVDWNISSKDQIRGRYVFNSTGDIDTAAQLPAFYTTTPATVHLINLAEYHSFGAHVNNELRLGFNRYVLNGPNAGTLLFPGLDVFPNITLNDLGAGLNIGPDPNSPQYTIQNFYQIVDNIAWVKGRHNLKFGGEYRSYISPQQFTQRQRGDYYYGDPGATPQGQFGTEGFLRDLAPDNFGERSSGALTYYGNNWALYSFVNDSIKVNPHLTVNLGLRYEYTTTTVGEGNQALNALSNAPSLLPLGGLYGPLLFDSPRAPKNNWAPRIGIAYSPGNSGNTSIRAGFSSSYDVLYDNIGILSQPPQIGSTTDTPTTGALGGTHNFLAGGGLPGGGSGVTILSQADARAGTASWLPPDRKWPVAIQWNLGIQHSFGKAYSVEVRYLGVHAYHMDVQDRVNVINRVDATHFLPTYTAAPSQATLDGLAASNTLASINARPGRIPAYTAAGFGTNIVGFVPAGESKYNGLAVQFNRRFENGLQFQAAYTWSHNFDNSTADFFSTALTPRRPQDFQNLNADWATSALDRRHRFTIAVIYDMPYFKGGNWFMKNIVGNWLIAPIYTYESPEYVTVQSGTDSNLNGDSAGDRAILNPGGVAGTGSGVHPLCTSGLPAFATCGESDFDPDVGPPGPGNFDSRPFVVAYLANHPNAQYIVAGQGALSNIPRNSIPSRPTNNIDLSIVKKFSVNERMRFEMGAQAQNLFNHPQYIPGSINDVSTLGIDTTTASNFAYATASNPIFNNPQGVFSSNSRILGLTAKFVF